MRSFLIMGLLFLGCSTTKVSSTRDAGPNKIDSNFVSASRYSPQGIPAPSEPFARWGESIVDWSIQREAPIKSTETVRSYEVTNSLTPQPFSLQSKEEEGLSPTVSTPVSPEKITESPRIILEEFPSSTALTLVSPEKIPEPPKIIWEEFPLSTINFIEVGGEQRDKEFNYFFVFAAMTLFAIFTYAVYKSLENEKKKHETLDGNKGEEKPKKKKRVDKKKAAKRPKAKNLK